MAQSLCTLVALAQLRAADVMTTDALVVAEHESLAVAWELLARGGCGFLPVLRNGRVVGVIDDHALVTSRSPRFLDGRPRLVGDASQPAPTVDVSAPLSVIVERLTAEGRPGLVVTDSSGAVVGIITAGRVVDLLDRALPASPCSAGGDPPVEDGPTTDLPAEPETAS
jgi:CBS domain-containing protein